MLVKLEHYTNTPGILTFFDFFYLIYNEVAEDLFYGRHVSACISSPPVSQHSLRMVAMPIVGELGNVVVLPKTLSTVT